MSARPNVTGVFKLGLFSLACSALLLSPAGAAQVDYFKPGTPKVPAVQKPESKLPAIQKGGAAKFEKSSPKLLLPAVKGGHAGKPPSGIVGPNQTPGQQGTVFPKVIIHAAPPEQVPAPAGKPEFMNTADAPQGQAMNKSSPILMPPGAAEPPPPGQAGEVMQKVRGGEAMNKATPILMQHSAGEPPPPGEAGDVMQKVRGGEAMNKATPILMQHSAGEPPPPGQAGEVMHKVQGAEGMNKATPILMQPGASEPPAPK